MRGHGRLMGFIAGLSLVFLSLSPAHPSAAPEAARWDSFRPAPAAPQVLAPEATERALFEAINRERAARGMPSVSLSSALSVVARMHSVEMAGTGRLEHELPEGGSLKERLEEAGIPFVSSAENVARGDSFDAALIHEALMSSEGHRRNILLPDVDEVGIGVARGTGGVCYVTQDFIRSVTWLDEAAVRAAVLDVLGEMRRNLGLAPLRIVDDVTEKAQMFVRFKAEGRAVPPVPEMFGETRVNFYAGLDLDRIFGLIKERPVGRFEMAGVGVLVGPDAEYPSGAYHICTMYLAGNPALSLNGPERGPAVLRALNEARARLNLGPLELDPSLGRRADQLGRRYLKSKLAVRASVRRQVAVFYETPALESLPSPLPSPVLNRDARKVGISVKPAGEGLTVYALVVLVFED